MKKFSLYVLIAIFFVTGGCEVLGLKKSAKYPSDVTSPMQKEFNQAEALYQRKSYGEALKAYRNFIEVNPYNKLTDESYYKIGKIHFVRGNWGEVMEEMRTLKSRSPDEVYRSKAGLMSAHAAYQNKDSQGAQRLLNQTEADPLTDPLKLRYYSLVVKSAEDLGGHRDKIDYAILKLADLYEGKSSLEGVSSAEIVTRSEVTRRLETWLGSPIQGGVPGWYSSYPKGYSKPFIEYKLGKSYLESGDKARAQKQLSQYVNAYGNHKYADSARQMLDGIGGLLADAAPVRSSGDTVKIGVLLPLSGAKANFGEATLRGIKCALGQDAGCGTRFQPEGAPPAELVIKDSSDSPEVVARQVDELADAGVDAIIGPMSAGLAQAASERAQARKVIIFPITQKPDLMAIGNHVFQMGYVADRQMQDLVAMAKKRGIKTFGLFYPSNSYGEEMSDAFTKAVDAMGGTITSKVGYNPSVPDMLPYAEKLKAKPFQAVFIPDSFAGLSRIVAAFTGAGILDLPLMGTTAWNDARFPNDQLGHFPGSFFVDLFYPSARDGFIPSFVDAYRTAYMRAPTSIEALGFDAAWAIRKAAHSAGSAKTEKIRRALFSESSIDGLTRIGSFRENDDPVIHPYYIQSGATGLSLVSE